MSRTQAIDVRRTVAVGWPVLPALGLSLGLIVAFAAPEPLEALVGMMLIAPAIAALGGLGLGGGQAAVLRRVRLRLRGRAAQSSGSDGSPFRGRARRRVDDPTRRAASSLKVMRTLCGSLAVLAWAVGCTGSADTRREDDVFIAALQAEMRLVLGDTPGSAAPTFCVAIDPGDAPQSPRKKFVARLKHPSLHVVRSAECDVRGDGVLEVPTGRAAVLITVGPVEWVKADEAEVDVVTTRRTAENMRRRYRVVYEAGRWVCLGQIMKIAPA